MNEKQALFVKEYLIDLNAAKAAIRAGYSETSAYNLGYRLLRNVEVRAAIEAALEARGERLAVSGDLVLKELAKIAFSDIRQVATWTEGGVRFRPSEEVDDETAAAIQEISESSTDNQRTTRTQLKVKMHDKMKALTLLSQHLGLTPADEFSNMTRTELVDYLKKNLPELDK